MKQISNIRILFFLYLCLTGNCKKPLYLAGLFPMETLPGTDAFIPGPQVLPAVEIAINHINNRTDILPDYELILIWNDTKANGAVGTKALLEFIYNEPTKIMLLGPLLSKVVIHVSAAAPAWNLLQVSCVSRSAEMNDRSRYPLFFRTLQEDSAFNYARLRFLKHFGWKRVAILYESHAGNIYYSTAEKLTELLADHNITVELVHNVDSDIQSALMDIKKQDVRVIIAGFFSDTTANIYCEAFKLGLYGKKYIWILPGWLDLDLLQMFFRRTDCAFEDLMEVVNGDFFFGNKQPELINDDNQVFGMTFREFRSEYLHRSNLTDLSQYTLYCFDAMLSIGLTLHEAALRGHKLENFHYGDSNLAIEFADILYNLSVDGITGPIAFDRMGNRIGIAVIEQHQGDKRVFIADYSPFSDTLTFNPTAQVYWQDNKVPVDGTKKEKLDLYIPGYVFLPLALVSFGGIVVASCFLAFNIRKRELKYIKLSSPNMNNIVAVGCILAYMSVIFYGLDAKYLEKKIFEVNCQLRIWVLACAFSMSFGALFSKTWRVHLIMSSKTQKKILVTDLHLGLRILGLLLVDFVYLTIWSAVDPFLSISKVFENILDPDDDDHIWKPAVIFCESKYEVYWIGGIIVYKGLLLMLGLFLAWETRNIRIDALNDSKHIGMCVYNVALMCIMGVPVGFLIGEENFVGCYVITSMFIILSTTITLCLVFVPKIIALRGNPFGDVTITNKDARVNTQTNIATTSRVAPFNSYSTATDTKHCLPEMDKNIRRKQGKQEKRPETIDSEI